MTDKQQAKWEEKPMTLGGAPLETGDVMTIRVALNCFLADLAGEMSAEELGPIHAPYMRRTKNLIQRLSAPMESNND